MINTTDQHIVHIFLATHLCGEYRIDSFTSWKPTWERQDTTGTINLVWSHGSVNASYVLAFTTEPNPDYKERE